MSLFKASLWFAIGTFFSRIFGLLRESVIAGVFGAGVALDAFFVANRIPNMLREMLAEGALGSSFTKVFSEVWEKDRTKATKLLNDALLLFLSVSIAISLLGVILAPYLVKSMTMISDENLGNTSFFHQTVGLTRLLFPFIGTMIMGAIAGGVLHQQGRFFISSLSPIALNIGYLIGALAFASYLEAKDYPWIRYYIANPGITGLAFGVLMGGLMQCLVQFLGIRRNKFASSLSFKNLKSLSFSWSPELKKILTLMGPMVIASSAGQINVFINTNFATSLETGAVTWLTFSFRLLQLPIGIFAVAVGSVALPTFTRLISANDGHCSEEASTELFKMSEFMLWLMTLCLVFLLGNAEQVISLLFEHGQFSHTDAIKTSEALYYYSFGLLGYGLIKVLTSFYYALERTNYAMKVSLVGIFINFSLNYILVDQFGHKGLAITAAALLSINAIGLMVGLRGENLKIPIRSVVTGISLIIVAFFLSMGAQRFGTFTLSSIELPSQWPEKIRAAISLLVNGTLVGLIFAILGMLRIGRKPKEALSMLRNLKRKR